MLCSPRNPGECLWAHLKAGEPANFCAHDLADLSPHVSRRMRDHAHGPDFPRSLCIGTSRGAAGEVVGL